MFLVSTIRAEFWEASAFAKGQSAGVRSLVYFSMLKSHGGARGGGAAMPGLPSIALV